MSGVSASHLSGDVDPDDDSAVSQITSLQRLSASRLEGTVWEHWTVAGAVYRAVIRLGRWLGDVGITPNALTYSSLGIAALAAGFAATGHFVWATIWLLVSGSCDLLDGVIARETGQASAWGALLDSSVDRVADALPMLGIVWFFYDMGAIAILVPVSAMLSMFLLSYVRARAESVGAKLPPLFMRRAERLVLLCASFLLSPFELSLGTLGLGSSIPLVLLGVGLIGVLSSVGVVCALVWARRLLA